MNGNLGRDKIWADKPEIWANVDKTLKDTIGPIRIGQKVIPTISTPGAANVMTNQAVTVAGAAGRFTIPETAPVLFLEISTQFLLTQNQCDNESTLHSAVDATREAARRLAQAEDRLIFNGQGAVIPASVNVTNIGSARAGLLGVAAGQRQVARQAQAPLWRTYDEVMQAISVNLAEHPAPYALVLAPSVHGDTTLPFVPNASVTTMDRLREVCTGGIYPSPALALPGNQVQNRGLLISQAGDLTSLQLAQEAVVQYIPDTSGNHIFRVVERIQWVARDPQALVQACV